jgi:cyanophycinase
VENDTRGYLLIIGGAEDKKDGSVILRQAAEMLHDDDMLTILTTATEQPEIVGQNYLTVFRKLGVKRVQILDIATREDANCDVAVEKIEKSKCIFMTGGDQLRITSIIGGTRASSALKNLYHSGGIIMGTSAGASVMSSTMVLSGKDNEPARKCTLKMAPGLGFIDGVIIDQHFDQRGRFGRLLCGVAENPEVVGIGIDEDTSIKVFPDLHFEVIGNNAVTVIDGTGIESSNVSELKPDEILAISGVRVDALPQGYGYDFHNRKVMRIKSNEYTSDQNQ